MPATKIELPPLRIERVHLMLVGDSPLIVHAWSEKADLDPPEMFNELNLD